MEIKKTAHTFNEMKQIYSLISFRLLLFIFFLGVMAFNATINAQKTFDLKLENATLKDILNTIERKSNYIFIYNSSVFNLSIKKSISVKNESIENVLNLLFKDLNVYYKLDGKQVFIYKKEEEKEQKINAEKSQPERKKNIISGVVLDEKQESVIGATIRLNGTSVGTITDMDGKFSMDVPENSQIIVSYVGYETQTIDTNGNKTINISLYQNYQTLDEVVVVGYGTQKKETVTGSIASIDSKILIQSAQANISNSLVGRMSGLLAVQRSGEPGNDASILRIRGTGTFAGSADPLVMVDGVESLNYNNLDPNEIKSVSILKDASATAVYGVRGASGVLLITTKRGSIGKPTISLSSNLAMVTYTDLYKNLGSYEYAKNFNEALKYNSYITGSYTEKFSDEDIEHYRTGDDPVFHPNTDWISLMMRPASLQTQSNLNISGGTDVVKYFINAGYFDQQGLFNTVDDVVDYNTQVYYKRYNLRSNIDVNITKRLSANINLSSQIEERNGPMSTPNLVIDRMYNAPPHISPGIVDGKIINVYDVFGGNPLEQLLGTGLYNKYSNYITGSLRLNYDLDWILKGLNVHNTVSYWNFMDNKKIYQNFGMPYKPFLTENGRILYAPQREERPFGFGEVNNKNRKIYLEVGIDYSKQFGDHSFTGMVLYNQSKLFDPTLDYGVPNGYQGIVGRITYDYNKTYLAEFNVGYNGTENFAVGRRFGLFPAYSLGWVVSEESIFPKNDVVSFVKIRGSYGQVGNDKIGGTRFLYTPSSYVTDPLGYNFGVVGSAYNTYKGPAEGVIGNPNLTWERAKKSNMGVDLYFWKNKIKLTADYFNEKRDNILAVPQTAPEIIGVSLPAQNLGIMRNHGYEADIGINNRINKFNYWAKLNYTYATNIVIYQDEVPRRFSYSYRTGQRYQQMYGLVAEGFYNTWEDVNDANRPVSSWNNNKIMPGDIKFKDINGDGVINVDDMVPMGYTPFPEIIYGMSFGGDYRGFDFSVLFQGTANVSRQTYSTNVNPFQNDLMARAYIPDLSWTYDKYINGEHIQLPHLTAQQIQVHNYVSSSFMIQDASYLRLKNAEIGYTLNSLALKKLHINSLRFYINGNNLLTWHGLYQGDDPEQILSGGYNAPYPITRLINSGFNIKF